MKFRRAYNNIECRFVNNVGRQLLFLEEWEAIKQELKDRDDARDDRRSHDD